MSLVGCRITGTDNVRDEISKAEFIQMKQLVYDQNIKLKTIAECLDNMSKNIERIADALEYNAKSEE